MDGGIGGRMDAGWTVSKILERDGRGRWTVSGQNRKIYCKEYLLFSKTYSLSFNFAMLPLPSRYQKNHERFKRETTNDIYPQIINIFKILLFCIIFILFIPVYYYLNLFF